MCSTLISFDPNSQKSAFVSTNIIRPYLTRIIKLNTKIFLNLIIKYFMELC